MLAAGHTVAARSLSAVWLSGQSVDGQFLREKAMGVADESKVLLVMLDDGRSSSTCGRHQSRALRTREQLVADADDQQERDARLRDRLLLINC